MEPDYSTWMSTNSDKLADRTLHQITLPGSHNSGNILGTLVRPDNPDPEEYCWEEFKTYVKNQNQTLEIPQSEFDSRFIPWNINHNFDIQAQLNAGLRFFHLKILIDSTQPYSFNQVFHQHRGYISITLSSIFKTFSEFLEKNPKEIILIGINNLTGFNKKNLESFMNDVQQFWKGKTLNFEEVKNTKIKDLIKNNKRIGIFMKESNNSNEIISTEKYLHEKWDISGHSGDTKKFTEFLIADIRKSSNIEKNNYFVLQANPNNNKNAMFESVLKNDKNSLEKWQTEFMNSVHEFILRTMEGKENEWRINAINIDFHEITEVTKLALKLNGI